MLYELQFFKLIIGLLILTLTLRLMGKNAMAQITPYDLVYIIVLGGVLDSSFYDDEIGILPFIFSVVVWSFSIYTIELLVRKFHLFRVFFRGTPDCIIEDGTFNMSLFKKNKMDMEQLRVILRQKGIFSLKEVKDCYIEPDGTVSVIKYMDYQPVVNSSFHFKNKEMYHNILLIDEGKIEMNALNYINQTVEWLLDEMRKLGVGDISTIYYCEWSDQDGFYYKSRKDLLIHQRTGDLN